MKRRTCLAAIAGVAGTSLAGCAALDEETVLDAPVEQRDGRSVYYRYYDGDDEVLRVSFTVAAETAAAQRVRAYVEQPADTVLDDYRFRIRPDPTTDAAAEVYLRPPPVGHADEFATSRDGDWTIVEGRYEDDRRVTTGIEVLVIGNGHDNGGHPPLLVDYEVHLAGAGFLDDRYVARDQQTLEYSTPEAES